jgi:hypothetical protein
MERPCQASSEARFWVLEGACFWVWNERSEKVGRFDDESR